MPLSNAEHVLIRAEFDAFPGTYAALNDVDATTELNVVDKVQVRDRVSGASAFDVTDGSEYEGLATDAMREEWRSLCAIEFLDPANGKPAREAAVRIFGGASVTVVALQTLRNETVSRASQIGVRKVTTYDVTVARAL